MFDRAAAAVIAIVIATGAALAEGEFNGTDAAFIDWGVKNCGLKSTDAEHKLVEAATAKGQDAFSRQYLKQFESPQFKETADSRDKRDRLCRDVKEWYGKEGTRIPRLLVGADETPPSGNSSPPAKSAASPAGKQGGGRHRGGI